MGKAMTERAEKPDHYIYPWLNFFPETLKFYLAAVRHYQLRLDDEIVKITSDELFKELFDESVLETFAIAKEAKRFKRIGDRIQEILDKNPDAWDYDLNITHGDVRVLKSVGLLYLNSLRARRDQIAVQNRFSRAALEALDTKLAEYQEKLTQGVFAEASPIDLLVDIPDEESAQVPDEPEAPLRPAPPKAISTIELLDPRLRERCLDLFYTFDQSGQPHRFDTVVSEATRILEDRIRRLSGADSSLDGVKLVRFAFSGDDPPLVLSQEKSEQESAHPLLRGFFGLIRNPFHHNLIEEVPRERVLQILAMIDYLIFLSQSAKRKPNSASIDPVNQDT